MRFVENATVASSRFLSIQTSINTPLVKLCFVRTTIPTKARAASVWKAWRCLYANRDPLIDCSTTRTPTSVAGKSRRHSRIPLVIGSCRESVYCNFASMSTFVDYILRTQFIGVHAQSSLQPEIIL